jgi:hypothetical protein
MNVGRTARAVASANAERLAAPFIAALTDRDLSTVVVRRLEHWNPLWQRKLRLAERNKLHEQPQIIGVVTGKFFAPISLASSVTRLRSR